MPHKRRVGTYSENFPGCDYTDEEWAFIKAIAAYQKRWNRRYPSWREVLYVLRCLGYRKVAGAIVIEPEPTAAEIELFKAAKATAPAEQSAAG